LDAGIPWQMTALQSNSSWAFTGAIRHLQKYGVITKILHGAKPADIPVDYSIRFRLVVNLQTAKALRLQIPESVLIQADEVIT
jgi:putative ABC transport system substrate-binding protein